MPPKKKKFSFASKVGANVETQKRQEMGFSYLDLPDDVPQFKVDKKGTIEFDIIPYFVTSKEHLDRNESREIAMEGDPWYRRPFMVVRDIGADKRTMVSPRTIKERCPVDEYQAKMVQNGEDPKLVKALNPSYRNLYLIIPRDHKDYEEVIHVWDVSQYVFQRLLNEELREDESRMAFPDWDEGLRLKVRFTEKVFQGNKFTEVSRIDFEERDPIEKKFRTNVPNLDEMLMISSYDELKSMLLELPPGSDDGTEDPDPDEHEKAEEMARKPKGKERPKTKRERGDEEEEPPDPEPEEEKGEEAPEYDDKDPEEQKPSETAAEEPPDPEDGDEEWDGEEWDDDVAF